MAVIIKLLLAFVLIPLSIHTPICLGATLHLSKSLPHYVNELEFYYQKPKPGTVADLLRGFERSGVIGNPEHQLPLASFLAELAILGKVDLADLAFRTKSLGRNVRRILAWSVHLAREPRENQLLSELLDADDVLLASQIKRSPAPLSAWPIREKSVLFMYWTAFMASGGRPWLEPIVALALDYGSPKGGAAHSALAALAAATLYENASRHPVLASLLQEKLNTASGREREILGMILRH